VECGALTPCTIHLTLEKALISQKETKMFKYFAVLTLVLVGATTATAATWNVFQRASNDRFITFFDASTVIKKGNVVTLWTKFVNDVKKPDKDGSYATAEKTEYSCKKRTSRVLSKSHYNKEHEFVKSSGASDTVDDIAPDTIGEDILNAVCTPDFPKNTSKDLYFPIEGNDIFLFAANYFKNQEERTTDLAPTTAATWYVFNHAYNDTVNIYFDKDSVLKTGDTITIWAKYVTDVKHPDEDGSYSTAQKMEFSCSNNTVQFFNSSIYDKGGKFIKAFTKPGKVQEIKSGTLNNAMLTAVCTPDFPKSESREQYYPVEGNDIYKDAAGYFKTLEGKSTDMAPK
jgi:hypothetical protein